MGPESLFIDIMMNVPIIFYAAKATGDEDLYRIALDHCRTTERTIVRPDGWTAHEGRFDLKRASSSASRPTRACAATPPGPAAWPGRSTASAPGYEQQRPG